MKDQFPLVKVMKSEGSARLTRFDNAEEFAGP